MTETKLCKVCSNREPHGYVHGSGEYLEDTCLPCFRKRRTIGDNFIEGGNAKRGTRCPGPGNREDK